MEEGMCEGLDRNFEERFELWEVGLVGWDYEIEEEGEELEEEVEGEEDEGKFEVDEEGGILGRLEKGSRFIELY